MANFGDSPSDCEFIHMFAASDGNDQGEKVLSNGDDLLDQSQTVCLLGKDLPAEARSIRPPSPGKRNSVTEDDRPSSHVMKVFCGMNDRTRPPSLLERGLLPGFRRGANMSGSSTPSQLTIFYAGAVHVYDNVPFDKAQAIMLLAGESSSSKHGLFPRPEETKGITHLPQPVLPSICKLEADLPIARKNSLRRFLKKRHYRITSKAPHAAKSEPPKMVQPTPGRDEEAESSRIHSSLSPFPFPFPSGLGCFSRLSTNKCSR